MGTVDETSIPIYDKNYHLNSHFRPHVHQFLDQVSGTVLDIGCGDQPYADRLSGTDYIGLDISTKNKIIDVMGDATRLPFADESFDYVISTQVLEHLPEPTRFFNEIERVLRPEGKALVSTNQMYPLHELPHDYFRFTRYGLHHLSNKAELDVEKTIQVGTLLMRLCCEINYIMEILPGIIGKMAITFVNILFSPIVNYDHREEYISTGVIVVKPHD